MRKPPVNHVAEYDKATVRAIKDMHAGKATEDQQRRAMAWIIDKACAFRDEPYKSDSQGGERDTTFLLGRQAVARQIVYLATMPEELIEKLGDQTNG